MAVLIQDPGEQGSGTVHSSYFIKRELQLHIDALGKPSKTVNFEDIDIKGEWVLVSKPNYFYIRNYDISQR